MKITEDRIPEQLPPPYIEYPYPLPGRNENCSLILPRDLTRAEAERLGQFLLSLTQAEA